MNKLSTKNIVFSGLFLALGLIMPFLTGQIPSIGSKLLPMHIPVLLCGFALGWPYGLIVGFITPIFRSFLFTMPPMMPNAVAMAFELAAYGALTGLLYKALPKTTPSLWISLVLSMVGGRIVWGIASFFIFSLSGSAFTWKIFAGGAFINAIPGIILQLLIIPPIVLALKKANLISNK